MPHKLALFKVVTWRCATSGRGQYASGRWVLIFGRRGDGCVHEVIWLDWHQEQPQAVLFRDKVVFFFFIARMLPRNGRGLGNKTKTNNRTTTRDKKNNLIFQPPDEPVWKSCEESLGGGGGGVAVCDGCDETVSVSAAHFTVLSTFCHLSGHKFTMMCVPLLAA